VSWLREEGRLESPCLLEVAWNSLVESSIMARTEDGSLLRVELMKVASELFLLGKRLRSLREKPPHVRRSLSVEMVSADE
jgi:hypothetical protein